MCVRVCARICTCVNEYKQITSKLINYLSYVFSWSNISYQITSEQYARNKTISLLISYKISCETL